MSLIVLILILILIVVIILIVNNYFKENYKKKYDPEIDIVITWVNGNNDSFKKEIEEHGQSYQYDRYDNNNELIFCLRSIELYMPYIRNIYIITREDQIPDFLNLNHYQIKMIGHKMIIPLELLPTYNSISIENYLHKIPGLSEYFIYFNDDMIVLQNTTPFDFFDSDYKPIQSRDLKKDIYLDKIKYWKRNSKLEISPKSDFDLDFSLSNIVEQNNEIFNILFGNHQRYRSQHVPYSCRKSFLNSMDEFLKTIKLDNKTMYEQSGMHKFRHIKSIARYSFFKKYWDIYMFNCKEKNYSLLTLIQNHLNDNTKNIDSILDQSFDFLIIHNEIKEMNDIAVNNYSYLNKILSKKFPNKSSYEL